MKYLDYMKIQNFEQAKKTLAAMTGTEREEFERTRKEFFEHEKDSGTEPIKEPSISFEEYEKMIDNTMDENIEKLSRFKESDPETYAEYSEKMRQNQDAFLKGFNAGN